MKSAGEPPVWGENVNVFSPELVEKEDVRCVAVYFYFPLTKASVILHMSSLVVLDYSKPFIIQKKFFIWKNKDILV